MNTAQSTTIGVPTVIQPDIYSRVTNKIIADLEKGVRPWTKPWNADHAAGSITRPLRHNGIPYSGVNVVMLWGEALEKGYSAPIWMTFRQAIALGGHVRKGEHGSLVVYADKYLKIGVDDVTGEETAREVPFVKGYTVFNVDQIDDLPEDFYATAEGPKIDPAERIARVDEFLAATGAVIKHGGNQPFYAEKKDYIKMPRFEFFQDPESYYATLLHETVHWTRHPARLDRIFVSKRFGDEAYAMEELVAELGAAYLAADLGIGPEVREDHSAYIEHWLKVLKNDDRAIFTASSLAQKAVDFIHGLQPRPMIKPELQQDASAESRARNKTKGADLGNR